MPAYAGTHRYCVGAPPPLQVTVSVVLPPPAGRDDGLAVAVQPLGTRGGALDQLTDVLAADADPMPLLAVMPYVTDPTFVSVPVQLCVVTP